MDEKLHAIDDEINAVLERLRVCRELEPEKRLTATAQLHERLRLLEEARAAVLRPRGSGGPGSTHDWEAVARQISFGLPAADLLKVWYRIGWEDAWKAAVRRLTEGSGSDG